MHDDCVLVGLAADPAKVRGKDITAALGKIGTAGVPFLSRCDTSGTLAAELHDWKAAGTDLAAAKPASDKDCGFSARARR